MTYCTIDDCEKPVSCRDLCRSHYGRWRRYDGDMDMVTRPMKSRVMHGYGMTVEYQAWRNMISRCTDPKNRGYINYGGRGIKVCRRWRGKNGLHNFIKDMGFKSSPELSIERINNDGNYEPSNCRWATPFEQAQNRRPMSKPKLK